MSNFFSHPKKNLEDHLQGVLEKASGRGFMNPLLAFTAIYHDIAKCNEHFQNKLNDRYTGYSFHSYLSAYISLYLLRGDKTFKTHYSTLLDVVSQNIIANIIASHHSNLRNIDAIFLDEPLKDMINFINSGEGKIEFESFIQDHFLPEFNLKFKREYYEELVIDTQHQNAVNSWKTDSLKFYYDTLFNFSQLIEADKRDAGDNKNYLLKELKYHNFTLDNNLNHFLNDLKAETPLNKVRTEIRESAEAGLREFLKGSDRVFTLTGPTGAGKTFMNLKLANTIQQEKGDYGIIMAIPFTSIIDQISEICSKQLWLEVLNYTSISNSSPTMDELQQGVERDPQNKEALENLVKFQFSEETLDHSFVITTFVQLFQTLIGNRNSTLIKLPNFSRRIYLIDEFQSLPVNLYTFFYGLLQNFCERFDCYAILSTATMPELKLNNRPTRNLGILPQMVFKNFKEPKELLDYEKFYAHPVFDRYHIDNIGRLFQADLATRVEIEEDSTLVVLNTVRDSVELYGLVNHPNKYLLNRKFTANSRLRIINEIKEKLERKEKVLLISTQLIEAGVDLDFPVLYRDLAPLPSLIQAAGRCNRNGRLPAKGKVQLFTLVFLNNSSNVKERVREVWIYSPFDLDFVRDNISSISEKDLLTIQKQYFRNNAKYKIIGEVSRDQNLMEWIYEGRLENLGNFRLIQDRDEFVYFVGDDSLWQEFSEVSRNRPDEKAGYKIIKSYQIRLRNISRKISKFTVNSEADLASDEEIKDIRNLRNKNLYSEQTGLNLGI